MARCGIMGRGKEAVMENEQVVGPTEEEQQSHIEMMRRAARSEPYRIEDKEE